MSSARRCPTPKNLCSRGQKGSRRRAVERSNRTKSKANSADAFAARFRWGPNGVSYSGAANRGEVEDYLFSAAPPVLVSGFLREDTDGNGVFEGSDAGISGARVFFDRDGDGFVDGNEPRGITDGNGFYQFEVNTSTSVDLTLRVDSSAGTPIADGSLLPVDPVDGIFVQTVDASSSVDADFLYRTAQGARGTVFADTNNNGLREGAEAGIAGVTVELLQQGGSSLEVIDTTTTDSEGAYTFDILAAGDYEIRIVQDPDPFVSQTLPAAGANAQVTVTAGQVVSTGTDFGVFDEKITFTLDYGDLIVDAATSRNYPTTLADDGARHTVSETIYLGAAPPDADPGTLTSFGATADDEFVGDDEEGVVFISPSVEANSTITFEIDATGEGGLLHAWIDFNNDGDWDDLGEQIATNRPLVSGLTNTVTVNTPISVSETAAFYAARFRFSTDADLGVTGLASDGEVEDYLIPRVNSGGGAEVTAGDFNADGSVDDLDYDLWLANFNSTTNLSADGNGDGRVDINDYTIWRDAKEAAASAAAAAATAAPPVDPEPVAVTPPLVVTMPIVETQPEEPVATETPTETPTRPERRARLAARGRLAPTSDDAPTRRSFARADDAEVRDAVDAALLQLAAGDEVDPDDAERVEERSSRRERPARRRALEREFSDEALDLAFSL